MNDKKSFSIVNLLRRPGLRAIPVMIVLMVSLIAGRVLNTIHAATTPGEVGPGHAVYTSPDFPTDIQQFAWSPDSQRLAMVNFIGQITIQDATTGEQMVTFALPIALGDSIMALAWSPDGTTLMGETEASLTQSKQVYFINPVDGTLLSSTVIDPGTDPGLAASGGGIALGVHFPLRGGGFTLGYGSAWSPDGSVLATAVSGSGSAVIIWDPKAGQKVEVLNDPSVPPAVSVSWSPDGNDLVVEGADGTARVWDIHTEQEIFSHQGLQAFWGPHGSTLAIDNFLHNRIEIWDVTANKLMAFYPIAAASLSWSPDGSFIVSGDDSTTTDIWSTATGQQQFTFFDKHGILHSASWSPNGSYIVTDTQFLDGSGGHVIVWTAN